ncbi:pyridoxamine 5'-phosphate oxidase family protein [Roseomonas sp. GC11]|uniref:pyridoxamine 5'-phosphate oxidase family protein n=1 Tax=Roseomonas sp. GC11 TaxID=2950546 RepID=UPI00210E42CF|nr:pyridoxamine 5'-phosphate oxidase family protein [Roseomonas sp. GC11]MCQ4161428.1 pyridoxamine 5'-phosphate oxidase family protein [Roseomonas sp. GC11]
MRSAQDDNEARIKVREMVAGIGTAIMTTVDMQGRLHGRPMRGLMAEHDDLTLWFFTRLDSPKVAELRHDSRVLLGYADVESQDYASLFGRGHIVTDAAKKRELWTEPMRTWLPEGPESSAVGLIAVDVEGAEYWDGASSSLRFTFGYSQTQAIGRASPAREDARTAFG